MARYLLDTNILAFLISGNPENISHDVASILEDYGNQLYTSSVVVSELLQLYAIKKVRAKKYANAIEIHKAIENDFYIKIVPFTKEHTGVLAKLIRMDGHNDPFDHAIISHAIAEKLILISSDKKFKSYRNQELSFVFNKR